MNVGSLEKRRYKPAVNLTWISDLFLVRARLLGHLVFWLGVLLFYTLYFGSRQDSYGQSLIFVGLLLPITVATTCFLLYWLIPRYLLKRKYLLFGLYFLYTLLFSLYLELMLVLLLYINVSGYQAMFVKPGLVDLLDVIVGMYLVVFLAVALNLLKRWFLIQSANAKLESARMEAELKLKDAELQLLKSQIHPHFLFNTLNNLYALALEQSEKVPDVVLKISDQLDYMLYRGDQEAVPIEEELKHIQNYLALEQLRYDENKIRVTLETKGRFEGKRIAPLLLIPFVENSFKHGLSKTKEGGWLDIQLTSEADRLTFSVANSKSMNDNKNHLPARHNQQPGIGLSNVKRRLALLYPNAHTLTIKDNHDAFYVDLTLKLNGPD